MAARVFVLLSTAATASGQVVAPAESPDEELVLTNFNLTCDHGDLQPCTKDIAAHSRVVGKTITTSVSIDVSHPYGPWNFTLSLVCQEGSSDPSSFDLCKGHEERFSCIQDASRFTCPSDNPSWRVKLVAETNELTPETYIDVTGKLYSCEAEICAGLPTPAPVRPPPREDPKSPWPIFLGILLGAVGLLSCAGFVIWRNRVLADSINRGRYRGELNADTSVETESKDFLKSLPASTKATEETPLV